MFYLHVPMCNPCVPGASRVEKKKLGPLELELWIFFCSLVTIGTEPRSSVRTIAPNHSAIAPCMINFFGYVCFISYKEDGLRSPTMIVYVSIYLFFISTFIPYTNAFI